MLGVFLNSPLPPSNTLISPTDYSDQGSAHLSSRRRWKSAYNKYDMEFAGQHKSEAEKLRYLVSRIRGDTEMWCDGGEFNDLNDFQDFGEGDGSTVEFQLLDFNIFAPSLIIKVDDVINPLWTAIEAPGIVIFSTAPADKSVLKYKCKKRYKCKLLYEPDAAIRQTDNFKSFATEKITFREVP